jgi:hypothetical protein
LTAGVYTGWQVLLARFVIPFSDRFTAAAFSAGGRP